MLKPTDSCTELGTGSAEAADSSAAAGASEAGETVSLVVGVELGVEALALGVAVAVSVGALADGTPTGACVMRGFFPLPDFGAVGFDFFAVDPPEPAVGCAEAVGAMGAETDGQVFVEEFWNTKATPPPFGTLSEPTPRLA